MLLEHDSNLNKAFCEKIKDMLNASLTFKQNNTAYTPRVVGDLVQEQITQFINTTSYKLTETKITKRSMADVEFFDDEHNRLIVDIKTHCLDTEFNMPNLCSTKRLYETYKTSTNFFTLLFVSYKLNENNQPHFESIWFLPIEKLDWDCLCIGALGNGQIQIKNSNNIVFNYTQTREEWLAGLKKHIQSFLEKEEKKILKLKKYFDI